MSAFYSDPAIRRRLAEYLGGDSLETATACYVTHSDGCLFQRRDLHPTAELGELMDRELDIARSLADREFRARAGRWFPSIFPNTGIRYPWKFQVKVKNFRGSPAGAMKIIKRDSGLVLLGWIGYFMIFMF